MEILHWVIAHFLPFIVAITILVFVHEWGHFWVARRCGVRVTDFSIGFGPELFGRTDSHGTRWKFSAIPMGGYVKMLGDGDASSSTTVEVDESMKHQTLESKTPQQRIAVAAAGPIVNLVFAWILLVGLILSVGEPVIEPVVKSIAEKSLAAEYDIRPDDRFINMNNKPTTTFDSMRQALKESVGRDLHVVIDRDGQHIEKTIEMYKKNEAGEIVPQSKLGIQPKDPVYYQHNLFKAIPLAFEIVIKMCGDMLSGLWQIITGHKGGELGGLIAIGDMASQSVQMGFAAFVWFLIVLSVNLGLLNFFPLPVLDGGHIVLNALEIFRKKPLNERVQEYIFRVGFVFLLAVMVHAFWNDLSRYGVFKWISGIFGY